VTTFVVLAAGRGSRLGRLGDELPKCLVPLDGRAVLSRQFALAPPDARLVVVVGYRADQVSEYVRLAHPSLSVEFVVDERWGAGPGLSLLAAKDVVGDDDLLWTACDTLWDEADLDWDGEDRDASWLAVSSVPAGTPAARWCRVVPTYDGDFVAAIHDKTPDVVPNSLVSTALGHVAVADLEAFWTGLAWGETRSGEVQLSSGLEAIVKSGSPLELRRITWLDVGDAAAYRTAVAVVGAYDSAKPDQVTYVLPEEGRVVKFHNDPQRVTWRAERARQLAAVVPTVVEPVGRTMFGYEFVNGQNMYAEIAGETQRRHALDWTRTVLGWWYTNFYLPRRDDVTEHFSSVHESTVRFYRDKTMWRVMALDLPLQSQALDAVTRIDWDDLARGCVPGPFHGDLTYANVIMPNSGYPIAIDWREEFAGQANWGDLRYDLGKLLGSTVMHWDNATRGDFRHWVDGPTHATVIRDYVDQLNWDRRAIEIIGALTLIGSAALHASPMDEILIARGCRWLTEVT
jgi:dTDP-glucose pyrophosphorylase